MNAQFTSPDKGLTSPGGESSTSSSPDKEFSESPCYDVVALQMTIYYNREGDHDHNGLLFALKANVPILRYINALARQGRRRPGTPAAPDPGALFPAASARAQAIGVDLPVTPEQARRPHPLVRPLVLRARRGETVTVHLCNDVRDRYVGVHLVGGRYDVKTDDGSQVGANPSSLADFGQTRTYTWFCEDEGVFPFHDAGNFDGGEDGTNVHGLFGALIVEPQGTTWRDPVTGRGSHGETGTGEFTQLDGLHLDVLPDGVAPIEVPESVDTLADRQGAWPEPAEHLNFDECPFPYREFVIFFHDEPEFVPPHGEPEPDPCEAHENDGHGGGAVGGHGDGHGGAGEHDLPIMAVSYRAEPMINRERTLWRLLRTGHVLGRPVLNEEQHHSSWMFGDPSDHLVLRAYLRDRVRIRFVHAAVKETHVFHLHLYEWHAVVGDQSSPRIDAISISPQTGHTIEPVWGAGNRHQVAGDVIWHCHLYPHFHEGMWGMFRTFETRQYGVDGPAGLDDLTLDSADPVYAGRRIGQYPDGTPIEELLPLPGNPPPNPTRQQPGYPLYIPGVVQQKSPRPPWPDRELTAEESVALTDEQYRPPCEVVSLRARDMPPDFDYRPVPTDLERAAFNELPVPGEMFTRNRLAKMQNTWPAELLNRNTSREVCHNLVVTQRRIDYNDHGWYDKHGHLYYLEADGDPADLPGAHEPLFFRAQHGQILNMTLRNALPETIEGTEFDHPFPPCPQRPWEGECAPHVHMVKFDPICADGASVGWNYMSGARFGRKMVYRWWADQEFGTIFFHDHLFANYRQKHGLFGALIVEPTGSQFFHHIENDQEIVTGLQALIRRHPLDTGATASGDQQPTLEQHHESADESESPGGETERYTVLMTIEATETSTEIVDTDVEFERTSEHDKDDDGADDAADDGAETSGMPADEGSDEQPDEKTQVPDSEPAAVRWFREFCIGIADFIPMWDGLDRPLNPPPAPGGHGDQGVMALNYRNAPLRERHGDPAHWFNSRVHNDPATTLFQAYEQDPIWLRIVQGSHEESHSFQVHALRWQRFRDNAESDVRNQQTTGIAEAFTFINRAPVGPGDYLYKLSGIDDLWLGCWGIIRVHERPPVAEDCDLLSFGPDPDTAPPPAEANGNTRTFHVTAIDQTLHYRDDDLVDPYGLIYRLDAVQGPGDPEPIPVSADPTVPVEPLVLWCREGEVVKVVLTNALPIGLEPEPFAPEVPVERDRPVSQHVSMHADLVAYDVRTSDGANVGRNPVQTVPPGGASNPRIYVWDTSRPTNVDVKEPLGPVLLQDMADVRNHRHHGLIGALVILAEDATPHPVGPNESTSSSEDEVWYGSRVTVGSNATSQDDDGDENTEEIVALIQDGLRLFLNGNERFPLPDPPEEEAGEAEHEDQGQKGINYRSEPRGQFDPANSEYCLDEIDPATPVWHVPKGSTVRFHLVGALDKPRAYSFTIHGVTWPEHRFQPQSGLVPMVSSESAITCGTARTFTFTPTHSGDHAYRTGVLKWALGQGMWGILRVTDGTGDAVPTTR